MLQTRSGKRTARAAIKIAVDQAEEGLITKREALLRVSPNQVDTIFHPSFDEKAKAQNQSGRFIGSKDVIYVHCPDGYGKTKINNQFFEKKLKLRATTRNWKTVTALVELASGNT